MEASKKRKSASDGSSKKRLKARVGKSAIQSANVTDTKFRAASLAVKKQFVDTTSQRREGDDDISSMIILSSRGKSLEELTAQLHHTASSARHSAVRGIANAIDNANIKAIQASLATLIPTVSKCCIDEDKDVRNLGLTVLQDMLKKATSMTNTHVDDQWGTAEASASTNATNTNADVLRPFVPLISAYATSALTSLDKATRMDGGRFVQILCTSIPTLLSTNRETILQLVCPYIGLLSDHISNQTNRLQCLRSLTSLLRIAARSLTTSSSSSNVNANDRREMVRCVGGKCSNAIFISGLGCRRRYVRSLKSIHGLSQPEYTHHDYDDKQTVSTTKIPTSIYTDNGEDLANKGANHSMNTCHDLMKKLYGICVELFERRQKDNSDNGYCLDVSDMEELAHLSTLISCFLEGFGGSQIAVSVLQQQQKQRQQSSQPKKKKEDSLHEVCSSLLTLLLNAFPIHGTSVQKETISRYEGVNSNLCHLLIDLGSTLETNIKRPSWIGKVLDYTLSKIDGNVDNTATATSASTVGNESTINVAAKLLLLQDVNKDHILDDKTRCVLLEKTRDCYFGTNRNNFQLDAARSGGGQCAATLVCRLLTILNYDLNDIPQNFKSQVIVRDMVQKLPLLLYAWDVDFPFQASVVLNTLINVVRHYEQHQDKNDTTLQTVVTGGLRNNIGKLFMSGLKKCESNGKNKSKSMIVVFSNKCSEKSVFERYPDHIQRQVISLIGLVQSPNTETMDGLLRFCTRRGLNHLPQYDKDESDSMISGDPDICDYIVHMLHTIRRSMSMQSYLGIIIGLTGIGKRKQSDRISSSSSVAIAAKQGRHYLRSSCRCLCRSGGIKTLPMIVPVLSMWLDRTYNNNDKDEKKAPASSLSRDRLAGAMTVTSILASLFLTSIPSTMPPPPADGKLSTTRNEYLDHLASVDKPLALALSDILAMMDYDNNRNETQDKLQEIGPVVALIESCPNLLPLITKYTSQDILERKLSTKVNKSDADEEDWNVETMSSLLRIAERLDEHFALSSGSGGEISTTLLNTFKIFRKELLK